MKKLITIASLLLAATTATLFWFWYFPEDSSIVEKNGLTYYHEKEFGLTVVLFTQPMDFYLQNPVTQTIAEVSADQKYRAAINGSYFTPEYTHAGLLYKNDTTTVPLAKLDRQVSAIVSMSSTSMEFIPVSEFKSELLASSTLAFQTGPLVIIKNTITTSSINTSLNGTGTYARTLLGKTESGQTFFVIVTARKNLTEIAAKLLSLKLFANDTISVINLDGGPSTALYTLEMSSLNFRETKYLPIIIGVR